MIVKKCGGGVYIINLTSSKFGRSLYIKEIAYRVSKNSKTQIYIINLLSDGTDKKYHLKINLELLTADLSDLKGVHICGRRSVCFRGSLW